MIAPSFLHLAPFVSYSLAICIYCLYKLLN
jgi:hypothetical protein